jgi:hypothetical protein
MKDKILKFDENELKHTCEVTQEGEWAIFKCPICDDYERRIHLITGEMKSNIGINNTILHNGMMMPFGLQPKSFNTN